MTDSPPRRTLKVESQKLVSHWASFVRKAIASDTVDVSQFLSTEAENFVNSMRNRNENLRVRLIVSEDGHADLYTLSGLDELRFHLAAALRDSPPVNPAEVETGDSLRTDVAVVIAAGLVAVHCARFDWAWPAVSEALNWVRRCLPDGTDLDDYLALRVAAAAQAFGEASRTYSDADASPVPTIQELERLAMDAGAAPKSARQSLLYWLAESTALMPAVWFGSQTAEKYRDFVLHLSSESEWAQSQEQIAGRMAFVHAELQYAASCLDKARSEMHRALQLTSGADILFIERCRARLDFYGLEEASRDANERQISEAVANRTSEHFNAELDKTSAKMSEVTQTEVKDALLRVVEILGVFIAVVAIAVTAVGGITAGPDAWTTLVVYATGFGSIVALLLLLRLIIHGPEGFVPQRKRRRSTKSRADGMDKTSIESD